MYIPALVNFKLLNFSWRPFVHTVFSLLVAWKRSKVSVDENGKERGLLVHKIASVLHDQDFSFTGTDSHHPIAIVKGLIQRSLLCTVGI